MLLCAANFQIYFNAITYLKNTDKKIRQCLTLIYLPGMIAFTTPPNFPTTATATAPTAATKTLPIINNTAIVVKAA